MYAKDRVTIIDQREMLRVKLKSLAAEARIIRKEEQATHGEQRDRLHAHRVGIVRFEARAAHLAYGFIRGRTRDQMEPVRYPGLPEWTVKAMEGPLMKRVKELAKKYGPKDLPIPD